MKYEVVEKFSENTTLLRVTPPMAFQRTDHLTFNHPRSRVERDLVVVCEISQESFSNAHPRTVIHAAEDMKGEPKSYSYGSGTFRAVDGISDLNKAMELQGYSLAK